mmetsp:Transcript_31924/g.77183  ORF Transcript_31924/g.77183 Transcript_31924/m.77183 type:complete len:350 (-) Transcript_31924:489-1538(-)
MLVLAANLILILAISELASFVGSFSTTGFGRVIPSRPVSIIYSAKTEEVIISGADKNATTDEIDTASDSPKDKAAIIFLHGLGDSPDGWASLAEALPNLRPSLAKLDITYVFPPAQMVGITVNGGEKMPGWFDVYDWPIGVDAKDDPKGLAMSVKRVEKIVTQLKEDEGIDPSRVVLGGFSQGGAVAIMAAYNRRKKDAVPFAGCICMSGWLPMKKYLDVSEETAEATPLFWAHGQYDEKILFEQQLYGVNKLEGVGVDVTVCSYPVGHESSNFEEIDDMAGFLESVLCPQTRTATVPKYAQVDTESNEIGSNDDATNSLLYYLCALGIAEYDDAADTNESIPFTTTVH